MSILGSTFEDVENQVLEFKEFYLKLHPDTYLDDNEIYEIIKYGKWHDRLNTIILDNIFYYLKIYIPKYLSCYFNSKNNGKLIIGISDFGEITGIPFNGNLDIQIIKQYISSNISNYIDGINDITTSLNIKLINLDIIIELLEDPIDERIKVMHEKFELYKKKLDFYKDAKRKWIKEMSKYCVKIHTIINNPQLRKELIQYIKDNEGDISIIQQLEKNEEIPVILNEDFYINMKDKTNIIFWATTFKDHYIDTFQTVRPEKDILPSLINSSIILSKISDMRYKFLKSNRNLKYYLITIDILGKNNKNDVYFRLPNSNVWYYRKRITSEYGPGCI